MNAHLLTECIILMFQFREKSQLSLEGSRCGGSLGNGGRLGKERVRMRVVAWGGVDEPHFQSRSVAFAVDLF